MPWKYRTRTRGRKVLYPKKSVTEYTTDESATVHTWMKGSVIISRFGTDLPPACAPETPRRARKGMKTETTSIARAARADAELIS